MSGVRIPIEASLNTNDVDAATRQITDQINRLGERIAAANRVRYDPVDPKTLNDLQTIEAQFLVLQRLTPDLGRRIRLTGQDSRSVLGVDWTRLYEDPVVAMRRAQQVFEHTIGRQFSAIQPQQAPAPPAAPTAPGAPTGASGAASGQQQRTGQQPPGLGQQAAGQIQNVFQTGLHAIGPMGQVFAQAIAAGQTNAAAAGAQGAGALGRGGAGIAGAGVSMLGGLAALGIGAAIGQVREAIGGAEQEAINIDTLKRQLGDVGVSFDALRSSLHATARAFDVTFDEAVALGREFARISGMGRDHPQELSQEVAIAGGLARSLGLDPAQTNRFFAQMRATGETGAPDASRRMALLIGETITRSGAFSRADEVLAAIGQFATQQTQSGLVTANVGAYAAMFAGLAGSGISGLTPGGTAALLGRVNQSIAGGGQAGEAGQMFLYNQLGTRNGLSPIQARLLWEQGAFGTPSGTFDSNLYRQFSGRSGQRMPSFETGGGSTTNLEAVMSGLREQYRGREELMLDAMSRMFGISISQSMALASVEPARLGQLSRRMQRVTGNDLSRINPTGILNLADIETTDRPGLERHAERLSALRGAPGTGQAALSRDESERLQQALRNGDTEALRNILAELTASRAQDTTEGDQTRRSITGVENAVRELAQNLVPIMNTVREGILYIAGERGQVSPREMQLANRSAQRRDLETAGSAQISAVQTRADAEVDEIDRQLRQNRLAAGHDPHPTPEAAAQRTQQATELRARREEVVRQRDAEVARLRQQHQERLRAFDAETATGGAPGAAPAGAPGGGMPGASPTSATVGTPAGGARPSTPATRAQPPGPATLPPAAQREMETVRADISARDTPLADREDDLREQLATLRETSATLPPEQRQAEEDRLWGELRGVLRQRGELHEELEARQDRIREAARQQAAGPGGTPTASGAPPRPEPGSHLMLTGADRTRILGGLAETDRLLGLPDGTSAAQIHQESGWRTNALSRVGAMGLAQVMPATLRGLQEQMGRTLNPWDPDDAVVIHREVMRQGMAQFGNVEDALRAYNAGPRRERWDNPETRAYVPSVMARRPDYQSVPLPPPPAPPEPTPMPPEDRRASAPVPAEVRVALEGAFSLNGPDGRPAAAPVSIRRQVSVPRPNGTA